MNFARLLALHLALLQRARLRGPANHGTSLGRSAWLPSWLRSFASVAACFTLSGCILDRLWETHRQFYAQDPQIVVDRHPREPTRFIFSRPTLLEKDIDWLAGQKPSRVQTKSDDRIAYYTVVQDGRPIPEKSALEFRLRYARKDGEFRLAEATLPQVGELVLTPEVLAAAVETLRKPNADLFRRQVKFDVSRFRDVRLPDRREIEKLLGSPNQSGPDGSVAIYRFRILNSEGTPAPADRIIRIELTYDRAGGIQQVKASYFRYRVRADLTDGEAIVQIE